MNYGARNPATATATADAATARFRQGMRKAFGVEHPSGMMLPERRQ